MVTQFCPQCGSHVGPEERFCRVCGSTLPQQQAAPQDRPPYGSPGATWGAPQPQDYPQDFSGGQLWVAPAEQWGAAVQAPVQYMGFWIRVLAALIDGVILGVINNIVTIPIGPGFEVERDFDNTVTDIYFNGGAFFLALALTSTISIAYYVIGYSRWGQTVGKLALGIKVVDANGRLLSPGKAFVRWLGNIVSALIFCIGYLMVAWDPRKQGLHDKMAGSFVIKSRNQPPAAPGDWV
jgi:uncharacterized RDD family membrane protein YckC